MCLLFRELSYSYLQRDLSGCRSVLFNDFCVPAYFREDLYSTSEKSRMYFNNYRYFVMGGDRSGNAAAACPNFGKKVDGV